MNNLSINHLEERAIDCAINQQWDQAVAYNLEIIEKDTENMQAYLRAAYAYVQIDNLKEAKKMYENVLAIAPKHPMALEQLKRIHVLSQNAGKKNKDGKKSNVLDPNLFLEIPGKTKPVQLVQMGNKNDLLELMIGQEVELKPKKKHIEVRTDDGVYLGALPDDISRRLIAFIDAGCTYQAYVKELDIPHVVVVFIREIHKGESMQHTKSFPDSITPYYAQTENKTSDDDQEETEESDEGEIEDESDDEENVEGELKINETEEHHGVNIEDDEDEEEEE